MKMGERIRNEIFVRWKKEKNTKTRVNVPTDF